MKWGGRGYAWVGWEVAMLGHAGAGWVGRRGPGWEVAVLGGAKRGTGWGVGFSLESGGGSQSVPASCVRLAREAGMGLGHAASSGPRE